VLAAGSPDSVGKVTKSLNAGAVQIHMYRCCKIQNLEEHICEVLGKILNVSLNFDQAWVAEIHESSLEVIPSHRHAGNIRKCVDDKFSVF
jgi:hypothetical protein